MADKPEDVDSKLFTAIFGGVEELHLFKCECGYWTESSEDDPVKKIAWQRVVEHEQHRRHYKIERR